MRFRAHSLMLISLVLAGTLVFTGSARAELPELLGVIKSDTVNMHFGWQITPMGDQNGDGKDDILIWDFRFSHFLYYGREAFDTIFTYDFRIDSSQNRPSNVGDINGDGYDDLAVGGRNPHGWKLNLFHGGPPADSVRDAWFGDDTLRSIGFTAHTDDINANGTDDIVSWSQHQTSVVLYEVGPVPDSSPDLRITAANRRPFFDYNSFGKGIAAGDFNGDGKTDLAVGLQANPGESERGAVYLYWGGVAFDTIPEMIIYRPAPYVDGAEHFGDHIECLGDVNADGYDDFVAGSFVYGSDCTNYIYFGGPDIDTIPDVILPEDFNTGHLAGDVNSDGHNDLITSYAVDLYGFGYVHVYFGGPDLDSIPDIVIYNNNLPELKDYFGRGCTGIGDFNGDGIDDFAFGSRRTSGRDYIYIFSGPGNGTGIGYDYEPVIPEGYTLRQNYPNPFNSSTTIEFALPERSSVTLTIYNVLGGEVRLLIERTLSAGTFRIEWDGRDEAGMSVSSGVYLYRLSAGGFEHSKKMVLLK